MNKYKCIFFNLSYLFIIVTNSKTDKKCFEQKVVSLKGTDCPKTENWCNFADIFNKSPFYGLTIRPSVRMLETGRGFWLFTGLLF